MAHAVNIKKSSQESTELIPPYSLNNNKQTISIINSDPKDTESPNSKEPKEKMVKKLTFKTTDLFSVLFNHQFISHSYLKPNFNFLMYLSSHLHKIYELLQYLIVI